MPHIEWIKLTGRSVGKYPQPRRDEIGNEVSAIRTTLGLQNPQIYGNPHMKPSIKQGALFALVIIFALTIFISTSNRDASAQSPARSKSGSDWADWRGPTRDGHSYEKGLPEKWSKQGENLLWKAPYGGRSAPIVMNGRLFMFNSAGEGESLQERVM